MASHAYPAFRPGGLTEARKIAVLAEVHHQLFMPGDCTGPVGCAAAVHASFSQPDTLVQASVRAFCSGCHRELATGVPVIRDGHVLPMGGPGLGTEPLPAVFERPDRSVRRSSV